jgi:hypothetical protein
MKSRQRYYCFWLREYRRGNAETLGISEPKMRGGYGIDVGCFEGKGHAVA